MTEFNSNIHELLNAGIINGAGEGIGADSLMRRVEDPAVKLLFDGIGDGLCIISTDFRIIYQNRAHCEMFDAQPGSFCYRVYKDRDEICDGCYLIKSFIDGRTRRKERSRAAANGLKYYETSVSPLRNSEGQLIGGIETVREITERRCLEAELLKSEIFHREAKKKSDSMIQKRNSDLASTTRSLEVEVRERKKIRNALQQSREFTETVLDSMRDALYIVAADTFQIVDVNPAFINEYGYRRGEVIGKRCHEIFHRQPCKCSFPDILCPLDRNISSGAHMIVEQVHYTKSGEEIDVEVSASPIHDESGRIVKIVNTVRNISGRKKTEERIRSSLMENELLLKEIHHRVRNNLQVICSLFNLQKSSIRDREAREMITECQNRIRAIALVHEQLYQSESLANINLREYVNELIKNLFNFYEANPDKILIDVESDDILVGINLAIPCGLIINELVSNSLQYAFPDGREGEIRVSIHLKNADEIDIIVSDNGVGLPEGIDMSGPEVLGLQIVDSLVKQRRGTMDLDKKDGTAFHITFSLGKEVERKN